MVKHQLLLFLLVNASFVRRVCITDHLLICGKGIKEPPIVCYSYIASCSGRQVNCNHLYFIVLKNGTYIHYRERGVSTIGAIPIHTIRVGEGVILTLLPFQINITIESCQVRLMVLQLSMDPLKEVELSPHKNSVWLFLRLSLVIGESFLIQSFLPSSLTSPRCLKI